MTINHMTKPRTFSNKTIETAVISLENKLESTQIVKCSQTV